MFAKSLIYLTAVLGVANAGTTYKATMTAYGSSDNNGSGNCVKTGACGFYFNVSMKPVNWSTIKTNDSIARLLCSRLPEPLRRGPW